MKASLITALAATFAVAQGVNYPTITTKTCTSSGCTPESSTIVLDYRFKADPSQYSANGIQISGDSLKLQLKGGNGPRVYLGANNQQYKMLKLVGKEITYDIETSQLDCNMNGALYTVQMPANGAADGTGYCDANGVGGLYCEEMDIWEANKYATMMTAHPTAHDPNGCGINPYAQGKHSFYGAGSSFTVDTTKPFTVVTQFITSGSQVSEIKRIYQQNGKSYDGGSLTSSCNVGQMGSAMQNGAVLAFSIWSSTSMGWLDSGNAGPCPTGSTSGDATITFSNIRVGDIGTTTSGLSPQPTPSQSNNTPQPTPSQSNNTPAPTSSGGVARWGQCGGINYSGPTSCKEGSCVKLNDYYSQCQ